MRIRLLAALSAMVLCQAAGAAAPLPMTPSGPWNVDFGDSMCVLARPYGADGATSLILKPTMLGDGMEVVIARKTKAVGDYKNGKAVIAIAGRRLTDHSFLAYSTATVRLVRTGIDNEKVPLAALVGTLSVDAPGEGRFAFAIPGIEQAMPVLSKCLEQLRAIYKVGNADVGALATEPKVDLPRLFPPTIIRKRH